MYFFPAKSLSLYPAKAKLQFSSQAIRATLHHCGFQGFGEPDVLSVSVGLPLAVRFHGHNVLHCFALLVDLLKGWE
jgi:hypothetical protein